jgi:hypothetical protein
MSTAQVRPALSSSLCHTNTFLAKSAPPRGAKRQRASKETENTPPGSDGVEESTTQAIQFEEDEIAEDIK